MLGYKIIPFRCRYLTFSSRTYSSEAGWPTGAPCRSTISRASPCSGRTSRFETWTSTPTISYIMLTKITRSNFTDTLNGFTTWRKERNVANKDFHEFWWIFLPKTFNQGVSQKWTSHCHLMLFIPRVEPRFVCRAFLILLFLQGNLNEDFHSIDGFCTTTFLS